MCLCIDTEVRCSFCTLLGPAPWGCCRQHPMNQASDPVPGYVFFQQVEHSVMSDCHAHGSPGSHYSVSFPASHKIGFSAAYLLLSLFQGCFPSFSGGFPKRTSCPGCAIPAMFQMLGRILAVTSRSFWASGKLKPIRTPLPSLWDYAYLAWHRVPAPIHGKVLLSSINVF